MSKTENLRGAALMTAAMATYTLNDACIKAIGGGMPLFQLVFLRGILTSALIAIWAWRSGVFGAHIAPRDRVLILVRTVAELASAVFFLSALRNMPFANIVAILQALPLTVALGGALFLREAIGWRRLVAILVGFVGVILIVRPGAEGFDIYAIYGILAVLTITLRDLVMRKISIEVPALSVALNASIGVMLFAAIGSLGETWVMPRAFDLVLLGAAALFLVGGYMFSAVVMRVGDVAFVAPFRYTSLVWALIVGLVLFGEWPDGWTLIGAAIVVATGLFTLYRENRAS